MTPLNSRKPPDAMRTIHIGVKSRFLPSRSPSRTKPLLGGWRTYRELQVLCQGLFSFTFKILFGAATSRRRPRTRRAPSNLSMAGLDPATETSGGGVVDGLGHRLMAGDGELGRRCGGGGEGVARRRQRVPDRWRDQRAAVGGLHHGSRHRGRDRRGNHRPQTRSDQRALAAGVGIEKKMIFT